VEPIAASSARVNRNHGPGTSDRKSLSDVVSIDWSQFGAACAEANQHHREETRKPTC
jgi:hypothetical protein